MASKQTTDVLMRLRADTKKAQADLKQLQEQVRGLNSANKSTIGSFTEMNQALELAKKGFDVLTGAAGSLFSALDQGQKLTGLAKGFETLQTQAGLLADDSMAKLRTATQGLVSDFELMQQANNAVQLGLDPKNLDEMAGAATKLGFAVGRDATEAFNDLVVGVGRGSKLILDNLGILVKSKEEYADYAESIGKTTDELTFQEIALEEIRKKSESLEGVTLNAGAAYKQFTTSLGNATDQIIVGITESDALAAAFSDINSEIDGLDFTSLGIAIGDAAAEIVNLGAGFRDFIVDLGLVTKDSAVVESIRETSAETVKQIKTVDDARVAYNKLQKELSDAADKWERLKNIGEDINKDRGTLVGAIKTRKETENINKAIGEQGKVVEILKRRLDSAQRSQIRLMAAQEETKKGANNFTKEISKLNEELDKLNQKANLDKLSKQLKAAFETGGDVEGISKSIEDAITQGILKGQGEAAKSPEVQELARTIAKAQTGEIVSGIETDVNDAMADTMKANADLFTDLISDYMTGELDLDMEKTLKKVAAGFVGQIASGVADSLGFGNVSGATNAAGLGQQIAQGLGFGGASGGGATGQGFSLGSIFENFSGALDDFTEAFGGAGKQGSQPLKPGIGAEAGNIAGLFGSGDISGGLSALGGSGLGTAIQGFALKDAFKQISEINDSPKDERQAMGVIIGGLLGALSGSPTGVAIGSLVGKEAGEELDFLNDIGFGSGKGQAQRERDKIRKVFTEILGGGPEFGLATGGRGSIFFGPGSTRLPDDPTTQAATRFTGLFSTVAEQQLGFQEKFEQNADFVETLFANIVTGVDEAGNATLSYNEALINTIGLFDTFGLSIDDAKDSLKDALLSGEIALNDYGEQLQTINQLQNVNLEGIGNTQGAYELLANSFDSPREQLLALEALQTEFSEVGITGIEEIAAAVGRDLGPEFEAAILQIGNITDSLSDLSDKNADEIFAILAPLHDVRSEFEQLAEASDKVGEASVRGFEKANAAARRYEDTLASIARKQRDIASGASQIGASNDSPQLGPNP